MVKIQKTYRISLEQQISPLSSEQHPVVRHAVVEASGIKSEFINGTVLEEKIKGLVKDMDFHAVNYFAHQFEPQGISYVVVLEESHLAIHTWPEKGYFHADIVTCTKEDMDIPRLEKVMNAIFSPENLRILRLYY